MSILDWSITIAPLILVFCVGIYSKRYVRSVVDFMSGGRAAGRYLLAIAGGELQAGAVVFVALFEYIGHSGFTLTWWGWLSIPVGILLGVTGFVTYRYRETRAMTLAQFFEIRYSKSFRVFTGLLGFFAGICNFGIIPAVGARCVAYFLGFPETITLFSLTLPAHVPLMALFLSFSLFVALSGGVVTVMIINCIEGIVAQIFYLFIIASLLFIFKWSQISSVLVDQPQGQSLLNPFDSGGIKDFNVWLILMSVFSTVYGTMAWQNAGAYNSAAFSPHEGRMGGILGRWREIGKGAVVTLLAICALTYLRHPDFASGTSAVAAEVNKIRDPHVQQQMQMTIAVSHFLPMGVKGVLCAIFLMGIFGGDSTHLHSWGSIFVQDVLVPLRKKPFDPKQHIRALRFSIIGVAVFAFFFGCLLRETQYIVMWWSATMAIFVSGAGSAIIGGLYWKKGTATGAWSSMVLGSTLSVSGLLACQINDKFPLNGAQVGFFSCLSAASVYIVVSLLTNREDFNMDRMLHRGVYATATGEENAGPPKERRDWRGKLLGIDRDFTRGDRWIAMLLLGWSFLWFFVFIIGTVWNLVSPWSVTVWSHFWQVVGIGLPVVIAVITGVWFTWGGVSDIWALFQRLSKERVNHLEDGTVVNHQNLEEAPCEMEPVDSTDHHSRPGAGVLSDELSR